MTPALAALALSLAGPLPPAPLGPGETAVEIVAVGDATRPADIGTYQFWIEEGGPTEAAARAQAEQRVGRIVAAARASGIAEADIEASQVTTFSYDELTSQSREAFRYQAQIKWQVRPSTRALYERRGDVEPPVFNAEAHAGVRIVLRDLGRAEAVSRTLAEAGDTDGGPPEFTLSDTAPLRADARRAALALARADADAQAAARGLRVVRIRRISERIGGELVNDLFERMRRRQASTRDWRDPGIATRLTLSVEFVMAPR